MQNSDSISNNKENEYILDAGAFYSGIPFLSSSGYYLYYTTSLVFDEIKHIKSSYAAIETLIEAGYLKVQDPDQEYINRVIVASKKTGDYGKLSFADISILALALETGRILISGDYAIANVASLLDVKVKTTGNAGIKEIRKWISYCSACGRAYGPQAKECDLCGNRLKKRYRKKTRM